MSMFNDISCDVKGNEEECVANSNVVSILAKKFGIGQWSFIGPSSEKKWYALEENSPQGIWDHIADKMLLEFAESGCPIFRATTPLSRCNLKSKGHGKLSIHFAADQETIETVFRIIVFANQLSLYGPVANICEEFESHQDRSGQPDVLMGQSIVLSEIKAEVPLENDIPLHQNLLLQRYEERIKLLIQENKVSKFCMDAGFIHVVENGQYFMTKDTGDFTQFRAVACREYTLPRDDGSSQQEDGFRETRELDLYWKSRPFDRINLDSRIQIDTKNPTRRHTDQGNFTRDEWNHLLCLFNSSHLHFYSLFCCHGKANSTRIRRRTSHSKVATYDESCCQDAIARIVFNFIEPGEEILRKSRSMEFNC